MARAPIKRQTLSVLRARGVPVQTVIDVGVLSGTPELLEAYPDRMHLLFEPVAEFAASIAQVYRNVRHKLLQVAVSDCSGETPLLTTSIISGLTISHSYMTDIAEESSRVVQKVSLDDYLRANPADGPYLLKIDIDGYEMKVLQGAAETLKQTSIVIIETTAFDLVERVGFLNHAGFRLFDLTEPCYYDDGFWQCDAVLVRSDLYPLYFSDVDKNFDQTKYQMFGG
jgi:FkbM family methyltransferase